MAISNRFSITGNLVDISIRKIYPAEITVENGMIASIHRSTSLLINPSTGGQPAGNQPTTSNQSTITNQPSTNYILPGFTDSHIHIESSLLIPSEFARLAVVHGNRCKCERPPMKLQMCAAWKVLTL
jgi:adenine deaminase